MIWRTESFLKDFYEKTIFRLPFDSQFRSFNFRYSDMEILPLRKIIRTPEDLRKYALEKLPIAIYVTRSKYLQAKNLGSKKGGISKNLFIGGDLVLDLDFKDFNSKEDCGRMVMFSRRFLGLKFPYSSSWVVASGRGFHFWLFDLFENYFKNNVELEPRQKETQFLIKLSKLLKEMKGLGFTMGNNPSKEQIRTFTNTRQIFRVVGSINHNNGKTCSLINSLTARPSAGHSPIEGEFNIELAKLSAVINASPKEKNLGGTVFCG